jgi:hypothetical protein
MRRSAKAAAVGVVLGACLAGCGGGTEPAGNRRPPAPLTLTAAVADGRIAVSPKRIGGGPVSLLVANLSRRSVDVTLESVGGNPAPISSGLINPDDTARIAVDVEPGAYRISAKPSRAPPVPLVVGPRRASAQDDLQLP